MIDMRGRPYDDEKENLLDIFESSIVKRTQVDLLDLRPILTSKVPGFISDRVDLIWEHIEQVTPDSTLKRKFNESS